jgi:hypothetical protein
MEGMGLEVEILEKRCQAPDGVDGVRKDENALIGMVE